MPPKLLGLTTPFSETSEVTRSTIIDDPFCQLIKDAVSLYFLKTTHAIPYEDQKREWEKREGKKEKGEDERENAL